MRWDNLTDGPGRSAALFGADAVVTRTFDTQEFRGITFHEVRVGAIAESGATSVTPLVLHLRPGAREWFTAWLGEHHPHLVERYERMYAGGSYAPTRCQPQITRQVHELAAEFGIGPSGRGAARPITAPERPVRAAPTQLTLL